MRARLRLLVGFLLCLVAASAAQAQTRIALVIGNGSYQNVPALPNPPTDASDVAQSLERLGFFVRKVTNASFDDMRRALLEFGRSARGAEMAVVYYAGHGMEVSGENWLIPIDAQLRSDADIDNESLGLRAVVLAVSAAKDLGMVILDSCRNNPFAGKMQRSIRTRAVDRGLARVEPSENVLVAYAARDGTTANDGTGRNSPFTTALLRHIETPGLEISFLFRNVRDDVMDATQDEQQPFVYGSLSKEEIYLKAPVAGAAAPVPTRPADDIAWSFLKRTDDVATLRRFIDQFPASTYLAEARTRIDALERTLMAANLAPQGAGTPATADTVLIAAVDTTVAPREEAYARQFLRDTPDLEAAWQVLKDSKDAAMLRRFADLFPAKHREVEVRYKLANLGAGPNIELRSIEVANELYMRECLRLSALKSPAAVFACEQAVGAFPNDAYLKYRLCTVLGKTATGPKYAAICNACLAPPVLAPLRVEEKPKKKEKQAKAKDTERKEKPRRAAPVPDDEGPDAPVPAHPRASAPPIIIGIPSISFGGGMRGGGSRMPTSPPPTRYPSYPMRGQ
jgi:hypothetical protein